MTRRQKIAVVAVLVAIVALYVAALGNGAGSGTGNAAGGQNGFVRWLGRLAGQPPAVAPTELRADCLAGTSVTVKGTCSIAVAGSGKDLRQLTLHAKQALSVTSRTPHEDNTATADVAAGTEVKVTVDGRGGDLVVQCADTTGTCTAEIG